MTDGSVGAPQAVQAGLARCGGPPDHDTPAVDNNARRTAPDFP